jgi:anti-sigma factor RsiW
MLSCQECERYLPVFLDQALEAKARLDVEAHLQDCSLCADRATVESRLRAFVRQHLEAPPLPEAIQHAILLRAMQADSQRRWRAYLSGTVRLRDFAIGMVTMALLALVVYGTPPQLVANNDLQTVVREASLAYGTYTSQHMSPEVVSADDVAVAQWLNKRMGYYFKIPCITDNATQLVGGRLCRLWDRKSAAMIYQRQGVPIVLFAFRGEHISLPAQGNEQKVHIRHVSGRPVVVWQRDGVVYSMVGDLHRDDLVRVASTINYR